MWLHFHARGAITNLILEPQPGPPPLGDVDVLLRVRAVGLNFRDVLNVLGEYPGDPGPPGADCAGVVDACGAACRHAPGGAVFGLGRAPLANLAIAPAALLAAMPAALSPEQACTLPATWGTAHAAFAHARVRAGSRAAVHAAAGGVGLKAVEYAQWLRARVVGTAGRPHKHAHLRLAGVEGLCSSRDGAASAGGLARLLRAQRLHAALNSLSLDFIGASCAALAEGGAFEEVGKRGAWSIERLGVAAPAVAHVVIALDVEMAHDPAWMGGVLALLAKRAGAAAVAGLPLRSFDMVAQAELAFRTLQAGRNVGKVVVRIAARCDASPRGTHAVTGGTSGLGLLTGRWLAERGARTLVLASRRGVLARDAVAEWDALRAHGAAASLARCDAAEAADVRRLVARSPSLEGVWHAAGVLADGLLARQDARALRVVYAPKAHGAGLLHAALGATALRSCALFSSVAALLGGAGQANYAAANACLDALATWRRTHGRAATSVQ